ncbi:acyltransferase family protein [Flavobacterium aquicola]|uniref:Peptidoglycan/LPS O-acetylase OafA/YrhL n=1 Tax=Flavobacterium aquicola TaxID=1682742 RepID=A0A3E0EM80_9FLAO|nr:acyltransferase [Flavobacterium aquicola]REG98246.1 peptidoglycan/LPS O-acetylase OafA/YrhL [Flavobacterium aquicola]
MIKSIQLLRTVAALGVVFSHYNFYDLDTGGFGVDIFFIISGFIIAYMVNKNTHNFMLKRIVRIAPLYYIATALTLSLALIKPEWFKNVVVNGEAVFKSILFIPYRIDNSGPILSLGWTLNNEMFFYLVMFVCIIFIKNKKYFVAACGSIISLFLLSLYFTNNDFYILNFYKKGLLPEFIYGLALYYFWKFYKSKYTKTFYYGALVLGVFSLVFMIFNDLTQEFSFLGRNISRGIPALLFVNAFLVLENEINEENVFIKLGIKLGDASYVMYLFHPFMVFFLTRLVYPATIGNTDFFIIEFCKLVLALVVVCIGSILIYEIIDKPILNWFKKRIK